MSMLEQAILLAVQAHQGQLDKAGSPYILHPLRMMLQMTSEQAMIAAVLHDVVEDTPYSCEDLRHLGFSEDLVETIDKLTRRSDESYEAFIERLQHDPIAREVKLADLADNMDIRRLGTLSERDWQRLQRYKLAWNRLREIAAQK